MGLAQYTLVPVQDEWGVLHDGDVKNRYSTNEAAFESAVAAASLALREGHEVHVSVPGREAVSTLIPATRPDGCLAAGAAGPFGAAIPGRHIGG
jgi:hypothetical protein